MRKMICAAAFTLAAPFAGLLDSPPAHAGPLACDGPPNQATLNACSACGAQAIATRQDPMAMCGRGPALNPGGAAAQCNAYQYAPDIANCLDRVAGAR